MTSDALRFGRYAYPPNALGYCGPDEHQHLFDQVSAGVDDPDLRRLARGFEGAWPYLELIAHANGLSDPLDARVVEAYWLGNSFLRNVRPRMLGDSLEERFRPRVARAWDRLVSAVELGALPHHSFHVFAVYPWLGLLREGRVDEPLRVLDQCRIRWGQVIETGVGEVVVKSRPLVWDGRRSRSARPAPSARSLPTSGDAFGGALKPGDWVSLHWDWVCERINQRQLINLSDTTLRQLGVVNSQAIPAPAAVLA